jgi:hypothetical protein
MVYNTDFRFEEIWNLEVLGLVDHGVGLEASNAQDASVVEDLKLLEVIEFFLNNERPRPLNSKVDNALLGVTNIRGLINEHDTTLAALDIPRITKKVEKAQNKLQARYDEYKRRFLRDENGDLVLPILGTTQDGIG